MRLHFVKGGTKTIGILGFQTVLVFLELRCKLFNLFLRIKELLLEFIVSKLKLAILHSASEACSAIRVYIYSRVKPYNDIRELQNLEGGPVSPLTVVARSLVTSSACDESSVCSIEFASLNIFDSSSIRTIMANTSEREAEFETRVLCPVC